MAESKTEQVPQPESGGAELSELDKLMQGGIKEAFRPRTDEAQQAV